MRVDWREFARFTIAISGLLTFSGCCRSVDSNPSLPAKVRGWQESGQGATKSIGEFVLKKGESIDNHNVAVQLVEITKGRSCVGTESSAPSARVRFFRVSDKRTILEIDLTAGNTRLINFNRSLVDEYGLDTISIRGINTKDGWLWFEVRP
jgi:hypothetical protein